MFKEFDGSFYGDGDGNGEKKGLAARHKSMPLMQRAFSVQFG